MWPGSGWLSIRTVPDHIQSHGDCILASTGEMTKLVENIYRSLCQYTQVIGNERQHCNTRIQ